ncbi:MAG: hypothetical protein R2825_15160 [Saprospiraceae bacterium]
MALSHSVTLTSDNGCLDTDEVTVTVPPVLKIAPTILMMMGMGSWIVRTTIALPVPDAGNDRTICSGFPTT